MSDIAAAERPTVPAVRLGTTSWRVHRRSIVIAAVAGSVAVLTALVDLAFGDFTISLLDVLKAIVGAGDSSQVFIVREVRLPQTVLALAVGAALGLSGALVQTFARNALASPDVIGVTNGAAVGAVVCLVVSGSSTGTVGTGIAAQAALPLSAFAGAVITAAALYLLTWRGGIDGARLVLVGIGVSALLAAITSWFLVTAQLQTAAAAARWLAGSLSGGGYVEAVPVLLTLLVLAPLALALGPCLNALQLGDDPARAVGVRLPLAQAALMICAVGLAAVAVAAVGPLGFVAFAAPHLARRLAGTPRPPLVGSLAVGASLVVFADVVARVVLPVPLAAGIVTVLIGAPYFLYLLIWTNRKAA